MMSNRLVLLMTAIALGAAAAACSAYASRLPALTVSPNRPGCDSLVRRADSLFAARAAADTDLRPGPLRLADSFTPPRLREIVGPPVPVPYDIQGRRAVFLARVDTAGFLVPGSDIVTGLENDPAYALVARRSWRRIGQLYPATWLGCRVPGKLKLEYFFGNRRPA